jgi:hypothetical protein
LLEKILDLENRRGTIRREEKRPQNKFSSVDVEAFSTPHLAVKMHTANIMWKPAETRLFKDGELLD